MLEHGHIEPAEMEELEHAVVGEQPLQLRRGIVAGELHQHGAAVALGELHQAEPVAMGVEAHGLGVDGHDAAGEAALAAHRPYRVRLVTAGSSWKRSLATHYGREALKKAGMVPRRRLELPRPFGH